MPFDVRDELLDVYRHNLTTLRALIRDLPDDVIRLQGEGTERWSILDVVCHLRDTEQDAFERVTRMVREDRPALPEFDPEAVERESDYRSESLEDALGAFERVRRAQLEFLAELTDEQWDRVAHDDYFGEITAQSLTTHMAAHDCVHMAQISRRIQETRPS